MTALWRKACLLVLVAASAGLPACVPPPKQPLPAVSLPITQATPGDAAQGLLRCFQEELRALRGGERLEADAWRDLARRFVDQQHAEAVRRKPALASVMGKDPVNTWLGYWSAATAYYISDVSFAAQQVELAQSDPNRATVLFPARGAGDEALLRVRLHRIGDNWFVRAVGFLPPTARFPASQAATAPQPDPPPAAAPLVP